MLGTAPFIAFIPTLDLAGARDFYAGILGLAVIEDAPAGLVLDAGGTMLRVILVPALTAQSFTVAGWRVADITASIAQLEEADVEVLRFEGVEQDAHGVWTTDDGDRICWFQDPDGNALTLTEFAHSIVDDYWH